MLDGFKKIFHFSILTSIVFIFLGICLFFYPDVVISMISYVLGGIILFTGVSSLIRYFTNKNKGILFSFDLIYGVFGVVLGGLLVLNPTGLATIIPFILGIWVIVNSIVKMRYSFRLKEYRNSAWFSTFVISLIILLWGLVLLFNPFEGALVITQVIGLFIIVYAVLDLIEVSILKRNIDDTIKRLK